jgi:hypothetical protein
MGEGTVPVTFRTSSAISKAVNPDPVGALVVVVYKLHGVGTGGVAAGSSFDHDIDFGAVSETINLLPGAWDVQALAWNSTQAIGRSAVVPIDVFTGMSPLNVPLVAYEDAGPGTFAVHVGWLPDILAIPSVEVEAVTFGGVSTPVSMNLASSVEANGSAALASGFYAAMMRIYDNGVLSVGSVEVLRVAKGMTSTWNAFYNVSQLESGDITFSPDWVVLLPLTVSTNIPEGTVTMSESGGDVTLTVTGADFDPSTSGIYAWYRNGEVIELSTTNSYQVPLASMDPGETAYYSVFVWQSGGLRAGAANWSIVYGVGSPDEITGTLGNFQGVATPMSVKLLYEDGTPTEIPAVYSVGSVTTLAFSFTGLAAGTYVIDGFRDGAPRDGIFGAGDTQRSFFTATGGTALFAARGKIVIPTSGGVDYSFFLQ